MKKNGNPSKRELELLGFRIAGYHNDSSDFTRRLIERRLTKHEDAKSEWSAGVQMRKNGIPCSCFKCAGGAA